mgnify:CR=1 FL=1
MPYIPHTKEDIARMLNAIGVSDTDALFDEIPADLRYHNLQLPSGLSELEMLREARHLARKNTNGFCFIGAGSYDAYIPEAVWAIATRGEFYTSYTPYQAEASQGTLQLLYEFQTMIAELTAMEVANASLYDGASSLAEAVLMAVRIKKHKGISRILVAGTLHPLYRETLATIVCNQHIELITLPYDAEKGILCHNALAHYNNQDITALIIPQPNFFGCLEEADALTDWAKDNKVISIACVQPASLALLKPPGQWGAAGVDIVCGEGQPLGVPMASGGPYFGILSTRMEYVRQIPGRLIGRTVDKEGKPGFALTLQAREQHIRREKATSNICTNQGLLVTASTIYMALMGSEGLQRAAQKNHANTRRLVQGLTAMNGVRRVFTSPFYNECLLQLDAPVNEILSELAHHGITGGFSAEEYYPELKNTLLVCATEMRSDEEIDYYIATLQQILKQRSL